MTKTNWEYACRRLRELRAERDELRAKLDKLGPLAEREAERELRREAAIDARDARRDIEEGKKAP